MNVHKQRPNAVSGSSTLVMLILLLGSGLAALSQGRPGPQPLTVEQIVAKLEEKNAQRDAALHSYESHRVMTVALDGSLSDGQATETVLMTYLQPASKRFEVLSSEGPELLQKTVLQRAIDTEQAASTVSARRDSALTLENYAIDLVGEEQIPLGKCYVLQVTPRTASEFAYTGKVWVQSVDFAVVRIVGKPAQSPSFFISDGEFTAQFQKVGDFYFPKKTTSSSRIRLGGNATFTIDYDRYRILKADHLSANTKPLSAESP